MWTNWKFEIPTLNGMFEMKLPVGAEITHVEEQKGKPVFWARIHIENGQKPELETRYFKVYETGKSMNEQDFPFFRYWGTFLMVGGQYVGHFYELFLKSPVE